MSTIVIKDSVRKNMCSYFVSEVRQEGGGRGTTHNFCLKSWKNELAEFCRFLYWVIVMFCNSELVSDIDSEFSFDNHLTFKWSAEIDVLGRLSMPFL